MLWKVVLKVCCVITLCGALTVFWSKTGDNLNSFEAFSENCSTNGSVNEERRTLSRRKRFLVFPEGSSLQLGTYLLRLIEKLRSTKITD